ncbi:hypothetical protein V1517DRAFT_316143, partial [Lipomyces orientalis]
QFVDTYAIWHNFATLLLFCKCAKKPFNNRNLPQTKGSTGDNGLTRQKDARSMLCDCHGSG